ncbi:hypothetical protein NHH03_11605 [Stieleria sp. TO1_6]|uniref:hypothetical protein n=1 Tax=Stieleria tagensis TaxID=2956795 RepID=UPI00209A837B|nr:hypothetical protein [Stieleria tagensis]MCO8122383.1 hypothetical protein [Stieleria tagensis]
MAAVEQCPYRSGVQVDAEGSESAVCGLVSQIVAAPQQVLPVAVSRQACEACVSGISATRERLNPVVASFLFTTATELMARGGVPGCDLDRATELQQWAQASIAVEYRSRGGEIKQRSYRECCHLGEIIGFRSQPAPEGWIRTPVFACEHPDHVQTTASECGRCRDWTRDGSSRLSSLSEVLPRPESWSGDSAVQWAVGVTTSPRRKPTLSISLDHLHRAGWDQVYLAMDGSSTLPPNTSPGEFALRSPALGAWPNYYLTLLELILKAPQADAILMIQDDVQFYDRENLRAYLESILWPADRKGLVSLYCSAAYTRSEFGWSVADQVWGWGALAFVFPMQLAKQFVCDPQVIRHRWTNRGLKYIDDVIGSWADRNSIPIWYPTPSLTQHIGETSTMWPGASSAGSRHADTFAGDA